MSQSFEDNLQNHKHIIIDSTQQTIIINDSIDQEAVSYTLIVKEHCNAKIEFIPQINALHNVAVRVNLILEKNARCRMINHIVAAKVEVEHVMQVILAADAHCDGVMWYGNNGLVHSQLTILLQEQGSSCVWQQRFMVLHDQRCIQTIQQIHHAPHTTSRVIVHGLVAHHAQANVSGLITIEHQAQHADSMFLVKSLLLHDTAKALHKPELIIRHNHVRCSHGSAIATIDKQHLNYLMSRGVSHEQAHAILLKAFVMLPEYSMPSDMESLLERFY